MLRGIGRLRAGGNSNVPNLLTFSEQFDNAAWVGAGTKPTVTANDAIAPDGTLTADKLVFTVGGTANRIQQAVNPAFDVFGNTISVYLKGAVGGEAMRLWNGWDYVEFTLTTSWVRYSWTGVDTNLAHDITLMICSTAGTPTVWAWGAQVNAGPLAPYRRVPA